MDALTLRLRKLNGILEAAQALVAEHDLDRLLPLIVQTAQRTVEADRCSLFLVDREKGELWSKVAQGMGMQEIRFPLGVGIAGAVASGNQSVNIADGYDDPRFNREFDKQTGYRTRAILCVPMRSLEGEVVGVLQALNKQGGPAGAHEGVFNTEDEELLMALGGQAAAAVNNALLHRDIEHLFEGFVRASVVAIEQRDPSTAGHSGRVANLSVSLGEMLPRAEGSAGRWKGSFLSTPELKELRYASLLHDFGKVGVRENVLVKANKLEPFELDALRARFDAILLQEELAFERQKVAHLLAFPGDRDGFDRIDVQHRQRVVELNESFHFVLTCNKPTVLPEGSFERLGVIAQAQYLSPWSGDLRPFLTDNEVLKLSVRKGSLTEDERREIESHVSHTFRFLSQIPWTRALKNVPSIAYGHHEKLTGRGYPRALSAVEIALPTRLMTISDIYDALTASDRPYKKSVPRQKAFDILLDEAKRGDVDADLLRVFIEADVPARAALLPL